MTGTVRLDPAELEARPEDPFSHLAAARAASGPVHQATNGMWCVLGRAEADAVLRDRRFVSGPIGALYRQLLPPGAAHDELGHRINFLDPPDHPRVRGIVQPVFTARAVATLGDRIGGLVAGCLDSMRNGSDDGAEVDLLDGFADQVPTATISSLLGVPEEDWARLTALTERVTRLLSISVDPAAMADALEAAESFRAEARRLLADRRASPGEDLLSALAGAGEDGERLQDAELLSLVVTLYSAGHRTTRDLTANGILELTRHPGLLRRAMEEPELLRPLVQEFLRHQTPTLYIGRVAGEDAEVGGVTVPAGAFVLVVLAAANRDPAAYDDPDRFDPDRGGPPPLSFAVGPHHCLGAQLARAEAEAMVGGLLGAVSELALADPAPGWRMSGPFRGPTHLRVRLRWRSGGERPV